MRAARPRDNRGCRTGSFRARRQSASSPGPKPRNIGPCPPADGGQAPPSPSRHNFGRRTGAPPGFG
ncbi:hypothetical protein C7408_108217 [Paraburkholderia caballeronis]|nr:hypothetical protein C7408_108217 [Paraburkholderia caballeronis]TDV16061.1 hypothetical protein C7406_109217 [Paraburkholderia caballeronis]TDV25322.1 hypothetical protein C7404_108217 [Paraburkholderia caballeronis]